MKNVFKRKRLGNISGRKRSGVVRKRFDAKAFWKHLEMAAIAFLRNSPFP